MNLPVVSGREAARAFEKDGWVVARQRGSHIVMTKDGSAANLSIPDHKELDRGLLRSLIRRAGLEVEEFIKLLGK
ncbi:MAG: type II toxin-antitoxin system HicA family toxin [Chloroflexota bacterium]|nr:MAG: type II toxin-antitoxin system HicA family toxin [Chloroflexota bacterium]